MTHRELTSGRERRKGATYADQAAHRIFDAVCTYGNGGRNHGASCPRCGTKLLTAYHEEALYSVHCPACCIVSLVKASNPASAESKVAKGEG